MLCPKSDITYLLHIALFKFFCLITIHVGGEVNSATKETQTKVDVSDIGIQCPNVKEKELRPVAINQPGGSTSNTG